MGKGGGARRAQSHVLTKLWRVRSDPVSVELSSVKKTSFHSSTHDDASVLAVRLRATMADASSSTMPQESIVTPAEKRAKTGSGLTPSDESCTESWESFMAVRKNRNACIHWLVRLSRLIEADWANETVRAQRLEVLRRCLENCQTHSHADCRELGALAPRMLHTLDFTERHFLNLMLPMERKWAKGLADHEFLVTTDDRTDMAPNRLPLHFVLDHLRSAFNVGALFRTAECLGVCKLWLCGYTATPEDVQVQRTTMGSHAHVDWVWCKTTAEAIDELKSAGIAVIGLETVTGAPLASAFAFPPAGCALVLGNERHGLSDEVLALCDAVVQLPCRGVKNSMNVAVSAGMCGYEIARQWTAEASGPTQPQ